MLSLEESDGSPLLQGDNLDFFLVLPLPAARKQACMGGTVLSNGGSPPSYGYFSWPGPVYLMGLVL